MVEDRRKAPRKKVSKNLRLDSIVDHPNGLIEAQTIDISKTGALCMLNNYIPPFTKLMMILPLPHDRGVDEEEKIECESVVVRVEPAITTDEENKYKVALFFTNINDKDKEKLDNYLKATN